MYTRIIILYPIHITKTKHGQWIVPYQDQDNTPDIFCFDKSALWRRKVNFCKILFLLLRQYRHRCELWPTGMELDWILLLSKRWPNLPSLLCLPGDWTDYAWWVIIIPLQSQRLQGPAVIRLVRHTDKWSGILFHNLVSVSKMSKGG